MRNSEDIKNSIKLLKSKNTNRTRIDAVFETISVFELKKSELREVFNGLLMLNIKYNNLEPYISLVDHEITRRLEDERFFSTRVLSICALIISLATFVFKALDWL